MKITRDFLKELIRQEIVLERSVSLSRKARKARKAEIDEQDATPAWDLFRSPVRSSSRRQPAVGLPGEVTQASAVGLPDDTTQASAVGLPDEVTPAGASAASGTSAAPAASGTPTASGTSAASGTSGTSAASGTSGTSGTSDSADAAKPDTAPKKKESSVPPAFRRRNEKMAIMQNLLYRALEQAGHMSTGDFGNKTFGPGYASGADGIYGKGTQRAINLLRKKFPDAPRIHSNFEKSVENLIKYLKNKAPTSSTNAAPRLGPMDRGAAPTTGFDNPILRARPGDEEMLESKNLKELFKKFL